MGTEVRQKIMDAIATGGEIPHSTILAIMLGVLDEIKSEIAMIRGDLPGLRQAVLNGHVDVHHEHHEWIKDHMQHVSVAVCEWGKAKMAEESSDKESRRKLRDTWLSNVIWSLTTLLAALVVGGLVMMATNARVVIG